MENLQVLQEKIVQNPSLPIFDWLSLLLGKALFQLGPVGYVITVPLIQSWAYWRNSTVYNFRTALLPGASLSVPFYIYRIDVWTAENQSKIQNRRCNSNTYAILLTLFHPWSPNIINFLVSGRRETRLGLTNTHRSGLSFRVRFSYVQAYLWRKITQYFKIVDGAITLA